jgi:plasmid stabilization system protein ParE
MLPYKIRITPAARNDIRALYHFIVYVAGMPNSGTAYKRGILDAIYHLATYGAAIAPSLSDYVQRLYGPDARTINYKKMTIVYNIVGRYVIVRRVVAGSLIR